MASLNYICVRRADIPDGSLQVLDLWPNESQRNYIYDPRGQTKYLSRADTSAVRTVAGGGGAILAAVELTGLAAYFIDHVEVGAAGPAMTASEADTAAAAVLAIVDAGTACDLAAIDGALNGAAAGASLTGNTSTGSVAEVLKVLSGGVYTVPAGSVLDTDGSTFNTAVSGAFDDGQYIETVQSGAFEVSLRRGHLAGMLRADFDYKGVAGAAIVIYDDAGALVA